MNQLLYPQNFCFSVAIRKNTWPAYHTRSLKIQEIMMCCEKEKKLCRQMLLN
jgi:hypothetical protein